MKYCPVCHSDEITVKCEIDVDLNREDIYTFTEENLDGNEHCFCYECNWEGIVSELVDKIDEEVEEKID